MKLVLYKNVSDYDDQRGCSVSDWVLAECYVVIENAQSPTCDHSIRKIVLLCCKNVSGSDFEHNDCWNVSLIESRFINLELTEHMRAIFISR